MKIYLVGGAVRDELLKKPIRERDWVVVGSTPEEMIKKGYHPVGKDFPVFLHPKTHEEYALARTERKTGKGYKGFHFYATPEVSLEADLIRRDLTINAMAKEESTGKITDPYHGKADLEKKILRHVSPAFAEDPVRILRVARFSAQLPEFQVHPETNQLMQEMTHSGEVDALVAERVWKELSRALIAKKPTRFFDVLKNCGAFSILFPEFNHKTLPLSILEQAIQLSTNGAVRFAALLHVLSSKEIQSLCDRFRAPREFSELALLVAKHHEAYHHINMHDAKKLLDLLKSIDGFRRPERFAEWIQACHAIYPNQNHKDVLFQALTAAKNADIKPLLEKNHQGKAMADAIYQLQLACIQSSITK
ncbi:MAG: multifunctional CCA tRNA nucleotidyl transferase/2'3'-cyclic phosphodiesterase/2'nucleotidase/phosphatase [Gammaproteobacteria bacterium CG_4_10_14_0_8_um_filter_38_16]|nr:MAG: multifunctional CCA tRNA nucleotidyl transferase/2'3'-cyclic phosphodiesterase/2'nucleotidase/phosphatase [Gammaproteobacteria bacterium CG_4_10_14_0_8_um_filter_38_16]PJA03149.1 MAG: multifunctional CCA tRNA nucleotidyl transferase/2'3'-cyclic phosphodiesterase/2'nucleotidase/phosphatase [Gammaproteobacteria bacterium CG_4_10_14_0_2_um_filter_38_22]PJB10532.1 MAG: multifunctional CCA tRNA nucleotidyl transferase/2'3'-cyclic phosphodiesterase/2'nucleotidase/phosphatase [Gammaproteobacteri